MTEIGDRAIEAFNSPKGWTIEENATHSQNLMLPNGQEVHLRCSTEYMQDYASAIRQLFRPRTKAISETEIRNWKEGNRLLDSLDINAAKGRVKIDPDYLDTPYSENPDF